MITFLFKKSWNIQYMLATLTTFEKPNKMTLFFFHESINFYKTILTY